LIKIGFDGDRDQEVLAVMPGLDRQALQRSPVAYAVPASPVSVQLAEELCESLRCGGAAEP
jgi:hypothetical protein